MKNHIGELDRFCSMDHSIDLASISTHESKIENVESDRIKHPGTLARKTFQKSVENSPRMVNQLTKVSEILPSVVDQLTTLANQQKLDNQSPVVNHNEAIHSGPDRPAKDESHFKSRRERKLKGIRISAEKLHKYELWCFINKIDFQDAVEKALDWLTSGQPVNHVLIDDLDEDDKNKSYHHHPLWKTSPLSTVNGPETRSVKKTSRQFEKSPPSTQTPSSWESSQPSTEKLRAKEPGKSIHSATSSEPFEK